MQGSEKNSRRSSHVFSTCALGGLQTVRLPLPFAFCTGLTQLRALIPLKFGDALWWISFAHRLSQAQPEISHTREPGPTQTYKRVRLGDVGYIRRGRFHLLFSAGVPRELGADVPTTFEPLDVNPVTLGSRPPGYLRTNAVRELGVSVGGSVVAWCVRRFLSGR
jgi:hypothetical protein